MPEVTADCFRPCFFLLSFFGRMVSMLGLCLMEPFVLCAVEAGASDTWGTELTRSVSTVICFDELSPLACPLPPNFNAVLD